MKTGFVAALGIFALAACGGETLGDYGDFGSDTSALCGPDVRVNWGGQNTDTGTVSVANDDDELIITISGINGWLVDEWHIYAGTDAVPVNGGGSPTPGRFPFQDDPPAQAEVVVRIPLASIGASCGTEITLAIHSVMMNSTGGASGSQTAWAEWDVAFSSSRWGGSLGYVICCDGDEPPPPPTTNCVHKPYYWAQKPAEWPIGLQSMMLGSTSYTKAELLAILALDWFQLGGDISVFLAHQTIGARINIAAGATPSAETLTALGLADAWFDAHADADGMVPYGVHKDSPAGLLVYGFKDGLTAFNEGTGGAPSCIPL